MDQLKIFTELHILHEGLITHPHAILLPAEYVQIKPDWSYCS